MEDLDRACGEWRSDNFPSWRYGYAGVQPVEVPNRGDSPLYRPITGPYTKPYYGWPYFPYSETASGGKGCGLYGQTGAVSYPGACQP